MFRINRSNEIRPTSGIRYRKTAQFFERSKNAQAAQELPATPQILTANLTAMSFNFGYLTLTSLILKRDFIAELKSFKRA